MQQSINKQVFSKALSEGLLYAKQDCVFYMKFLIITVLAVNSALLTNSPASALALFSCPPHHARGALLLPKAGPPKYCLHPTPSDILRGGAPLVPSSSPCQIFDFFSSLVLFYQHQCMRKSLMG